jgi:hypothetical protein
MWTIIGTFLLIGIGAAAGPFLWQPGNATRIMAMLFVWVAAGACIAWLWN